ncbi:unnamed protein product [Darwinula stevensoni]|uniref:Uncharacterized protein n=1 Tax=Darwinula stevensoni TaxID=69355 RepID=A0A7R8X7R2_9CRUS|nr:unnamed protein product [Darwinula stevensoni]CAG0883649.1 unnamed protein product [Darwinula stevensoni]
MQVISEELIKNLGLTLVGVFVVVLVMVGDLRVSLWVFTCILFTLVGIAGGLRFVGFTVEIMTSILMILSVGLAVDYSVHIAHKFMVIWLSVIYGLYHGLFYLPVMLSWFGPDPFVDVMPSMSASPSTDLLDMELEGVEGSKLPVVTAPHYSTFMWKVHWNKNRGEYPMTNGTGHPQREGAGGHESSPMVGRREGCEVSSYRKRRASLACM